MQSKISSIKDTIKSLCDPLRIPILQKFFKTKIGEYAEGDIFIGLTVPNIRKIAKQFFNLSLSDLQILLESRINEERHLALIILVNQYQKAKDQNKEKLYEFYLQNLPYVNNWNLVDVSCYHIIGNHLLDKDKKLLFDFARSKNLWIRRISIVSTMYFIRKKDLNYTFEIASLLLTDKHDLINKAVGWLLREAGNKDQIRLIKFLDQNISSMHRTTLRYATEKFPERLRRSYLIRGK